MEYSLCITLDENADVDETIYALDEAATAARLAIRGLGRHLNVDESASLEVTCFGLQDATLHRVA